MAIRNVVFDMGNVLMDYKPSDYATIFFPDKEEAKLVLNTLFGCPEWLMLDAGTATEEDAISAVCKRLPAALHERTRSLFYHWHEYMQPIAETNALVRELKDAGYHTYILSNAAASFYIYCPKQMPAYPLFDGVMVSFEEKLVKPDEAVYRHFCKKFGLIPEECLFIDDRPENVEGARAVGMAGCIFDGDYSALLASLRQNGVMLPGGI